MNKMKKMITLQDANKNIEITQKNLLFIRKFQIK